MHRDRDLATEIMGSRWRLLGLFFLCDSIRHSAGRFVSTKSGGGICVDPRSGNEYQHAVHFIHSHIVSVIALTEVNLARTKCCQLF